MDINMECICGETRERGEQITNKKCFRHGSAWTKGEIEAMSPRQRLIFKRCRAFCSGKEEEAKWWITAVMREARHLEPGDPFVERLAGHLDVSPTELRQKA